MNQLEIKSKNEIVIFDFNGKVELCFESSTDLRNELEKQKKQSNFKLIFNMKEIYDIDPFTTGLFIGLAIDPKKQVHIKFCNLSEKIKEYFHKIGIDKIFQIFDSEEDAIKSFEED